MYDKNDVVTYGAQGVCRIIGITEKDFNGSQYLYYELQPVYDHRSTVFIPVENPVLTGRMHSLLSEDAVNELISSMASQEVHWIESEETRRQRYRELVTGGDRLALVRAIKALHLYRQKRQAVGKRMHACDERFLKDAEKLLYDEVAYVLRMDRGQAADYVMERVLA